MSFLDDLERDLLGAAERRRDARRVARVLRARRQIGLHAARLRSAGLRRLVLATALFALIGTATAGAGLFVLRGSPIAGPAARDVPRDQLPLPGTTRLTGLTAADPEPGRPEWTLRLARSSTGLLCSTVGQLVGGRFGLVGLDGRFRTYSERVVDSCGEEARGEGASLIGARVFDADDLGEVRTVVNGVAGRALRAVTVEARGRRRALRVGPGGTFLDVLAGYPEDSGVQVELRFAGGRVELHPLGRLVNVTPDADGGQAWKTMAYGTSGDRRSCVTFSLARPITGGVSSPAACGLFRSRGRRSLGYFFAARRLTPGTKGSLFGPGWGAHPPRTAVWGAAGDEVRSIEISAPGGIHAQPPIADSRAFLAVFPASVDPGSLVVTLRLADGRVVRRQGSTNLVTREGRSR